MPRTHTTAATARKPDRTTNNAARRRERKVNAASDEALCDQLSELAGQVRRNGEGRLSSWRDSITRRSFEPAAANLAHYLALRSRDLRQLQVSLSERGLSSLGRCEAHVLESIAAVSEALNRIAGRTPGSFPPSGWKEMAAHRLDEESSAVFGRDPAGPRSRIMVTVGAELAAAGQISDLIATGADCIRINCAHDGADVWMSIVEQTRDAARAQARDCRILMDIAGPKVRIAEAGGARKLRVHAGDEILLLKDSHAAGDQDRSALTISHPQIVKRLKPDQCVSIDDGKLHGVVIARHARGVVVRAERARSKGVKLRPGKGINFPGLALDLPPLTEKDLGDLDFIARHADIVGYSFVQRPADIRLLQDELQRRLDGRTLPALMIKVETQLGVANLPDLIVAAAGRQPAAVMIARGDLSVELGALALSEVQEKVLWLCEAARIPVVWATQVLDGLVKSGVPTRAEGTDAAMAQRAECVMLNKGPHALDAVKFLDDVLRRMDEHVLKKSPQLVALPMWTAPRTEPEAKAATSRRRHSRR